MVLETEGLDTAFYEITKEGLKLVNLTGSANKQSVQYGIDSTKIDYTSYVKDVKVGDTIVPEEKYIAKLIGDFDTNHLGDTKIKVEVVLKEDPTHKIQIEVPVTVEGELSAEATPQTVPLGTATDSLDLTKFVKNVKLGDTSLTSDQYTTKLVDTLLTDQVGEQSAKVEVSLKSDPTVKVEAVVPVIIEWGNSLVFKDDFNNGFNFTAASISVLNGPDGPKLMATKGDGFRNSGQVLFYASPDITIYSKSLDTIVKQFSETTTSQEPSDVMTRWNGIFKDLEDNVKYGDIIGVRVDQSYGAHANQNG
ncbi:TPA: hypothetical protein QFM57_002586, partial [Enterococcus faecium]